MKDNTLNQVETANAGMEGQRRDVRKLKQGDLTSVTATGLLRGCCYQGCCDANQLPSA
jgi:hypothetical protein